MLDKLNLKKIFGSALSNGGDFADIFFESTIQTYISADNKRIEQAVTGEDRGLGIRVIYNNKTAYGFTNDLSSEAAILELASGVSEAVKGNEWTKDINIAKSTPPTIHTVTYPPTTVVLEDKVKIIKDVNEIAWAFDKRIRQVSIIYRDTTRNFSIANSKGEYVEDEKIDIAFMSVITASDGKIIQTGYEPVGGFAGFEFFEDGKHERVTKESCRRAILMLSARPAPAGTMPVVLSSAAGGTMVHEAVGHGLEADLASGGFSIYGGRIGEQVSSPLVSVVDDATLKGRRGSISVDDEGVPGQKTILIDKGILKGYMHNRITADKAGCESTGNGRRESYRFRPIVRMTNTIIESGSDDPEAIVKNTNSGLFVKKMGGGQVNTVTGDFVFEVQEGYLIDNGKIGDPVRGATLSGNGPEVLTKIDMVGSDLGFAIGTCGKDSQGVPVGDAQPTLRIPELVVGGIE